MPFIETEIWLALKSRISTLVTNPAMTIFDPNADVAPPSDVSGLLPFILVSDVRNDPERVTIGPEVHQRSGILMLSVNWPVSKPITHTQLVQIGGSIAAHFSADTRMKYGNTSLRVVQDADVMQPYRDDTRTISIVRVRWSTT